jgi:hypothetical protein
MSPIQASGIQCGDLRIRLQTNGSGQRLLFPATPQGERLAGFLLGQPPDREGDYFVIPHSDDVDRRILELIDGLTSVRWAHPKYTQLVFDL